MSVPCCPRPSRCDQAKLTLSSCSHPVAAYDAAKVWINPGKTPMEAWEMALAGSMAGAIAGVVGNPGEILMVRMQGDFAKPPEKRLNYRNAIVRTPVYRAYASNLD
jgi:hypothetical protein